MVRQGVRWREKREFGWKEKRKKVENVLMRRIKLKLVLPYSSSNWFLFRLIYYHLLYYLIWFVEHFGSLFLHSTPVFLFLLLLLTFFWVDSLMLIMLLTIQLISNPWDEETDFIFFFILLLFKISFEMLGTGIVLFDYFFSPLRSLIRWWTKKLVVLLGNYLVHFNSFNYKMIRTMIFVVGFFFLLFRVIRYEIRLIWRREWLNLSGNGQLPSGVTKIMFIFLLECYRHFQKN